MTAIEFKVQAQDNTGIVKSWPVVTYWCDLENCHFDCNKKPKNQVFKMCKTHDTANLHGTSEESTSNFSMFDNMLQVDLRVRKKKPWALQSSWKKDFVYWWPFLHFHRANPFNWVPRRWKVQHNTRKRCAIHKLWGEVHLYYPINA